MCNVFRKPVKWVTNHDNYFTDDQTVGNGGPRCGNGGNRGDRVVRGSNECYRGKNNKNENTG